MWTFIIAEEELEALGVEPKVTSVTFPISRYGNHAFTLAWLEGVTPLEAMDRVNRWMRLPYSKSYWERIREYSWASDTEYEEMVTMINDEKYCLPGEVGQLSYPHRGSLLTDGYIRDAIWSNQSGSMLNICDSRPVFD